MRDIHWPESVGHPGSTHAVRLGCSCSPVLNHYGRGDDSGLFKIAPGCSLHARHQVPVDGIRCDRCGAVLEVITRFADNEKRLSAVCPNGCTPAERSPGTIAARTGAPTAIAADPPFEQVNQANPCERCNKPIPKSAKRGRPRRFHEECLTPAELAVRARQVKSRSRRASEAPPLAMPAETFAEEGFA